MELVGHDLVGVLAVSLPEFFVQHDAVDDRKDGVDTVDAQQEKVLQIAGGGNQTAESKQDDKGYAYGTNIPRKTFGAFAEVEKAEYECCQSSYIQKGRIDELQAVIEHGNRNKYCERVCAGDAVDPVHEIVGIDDPYTHDQGRYDGPPKFCTDKPEVDEHQHH